MLLDVKGNTLDSAQVGVPLPASLQRQKLASAPSLRVSAWRDHHLSVQIRMEMTHCQTPAHMLLLVSMSRELNSSTPLPAVLLRCLLFFSRLVKGRQPHPHHRTHGPHHTSRPFYPSHTAHYPRLTIPEWRASHSAAMRAAMEAARERSYSLLRIRTSLPCSPPRSPPPSHLICASMASAPR